MKTLPVKLNVNMSSNRSYVAVSAAVILRPLEADEFVHLLKRHEAYLDACTSLLH